MNGLGLRFRELRNYLKMTQIQFAEILNISQSSLTQIEKERVNPTLEQIETLLKNFINIKKDVNSNWLLSGFGEMFVKENSVGVQKISGTINGHSNVVGNNNTVHNDGDLMKIEFLEKEVAGLKRENETLRELVDVLKKKE